MQSSIRARALLCTSLFCLSQALWAADPASGTLSPANKSLSYVSGPFLVSNPSATAEMVCQEPAAPCDEYTLTVDVPVDYLLTHPRASIKVSTSWADVNEDYDLYVLDDSDAEVAASAGSANPESTSFNAGAGMRTLTVRIVPFAVTGGSTTTVIELDEGAAGGGGGGGVVGAFPDQAVSTEMPARFFNYFPPVGVAADAAEPSIGYNLTTKRAMFISYVTTLQVTFPDNQTPALPEVCDANWKDVTFPYTGVISLDPILWTDQVLGRTFVSQLISSAAGGAPVAGTSFFAFTDDDGESGDAGWTPGQLGAPTYGYDHQTVASGPYPASVPLATPVNSGQAVYYCSQGGVDAYCARSDDGGISFPTGVPIQVLECTGLHGHVRVAPDGTVYVPNFSCGDTQGVIVSEDAGVTWAVRAVTPTTATSTYDPGVGIGTDGTVYFCTVEENGHITASVSRDKGLSWTDHYDLGKSYGLENGAFPQAIAGDADRAACAFLGTDVPGNSGSVDFAGVWHSYVAMTYDGGKTWVTNDITPNDPVQREGGICISGSGCSGGNRNLLDFNETAMDEKGRVLFAYADGCIGACVQASPNTYSQEGRIARQSGGKSLFAAFDAEFSGAQAPKAACLAGQRDTAGSYLSWKAPDTGGSEIVNYKIYRGTAEGNEVLIGQTNSAKTQFDDSTADPSIATYTYKITGVNANGDGLFSNIVPLLVSELLIESSCTLPGISVAQGPAGDSVSGLEGQDILKLSIAEPASQAGKFVVTLKIADLSDPLPPNTQWMAVIRQVDGSDKFVEMSTETGLPSFHYGDVSVLDAQATSATTYTIVGDLDPASTYTPDGSISLVVPAEVLGSPAVGSLLTPIDGRVRVVTSGEAGSVGRLMDETSTGDYRVAGSAMCLGDSLPTARLLSNTARGGAPLTVTFDGGSSTTPDSSASIVSYSFNFGDGSPEVTQSSPAITHTYITPGIYPAKLTVTDSHGARSANRSLQIIEVLGATAKEDSARFGGALGLLLLLPFFGLAALQRRKH